MVDYGRYIAVDQINPCGHYGSGADQDYCDKPAARFSFRHPSSLFQAGCEVYTGSDSEAGSEQESSYDVDNSVRLNPAFIHLYRPTAEIPRDFWALRKIFLTILRNSEISVSLDIVNPTVMVK